MKNLDPRMKLLSIIVITTMALLFVNPLWMLGLSIAALFLNVFFGVDFGVFFGRLRKFTQLFIVIITIQIIFVRTGKPIATINEYNIIYYDGLIRGINTGMRYFIIICSAAIMAGENNRRVIASLIQMKIPYMFAFMLMITLRFLPLFMESFSDSMISIQLRGVELKKVKIRKKIELYGSLLLPVVADAVIKSQDLSVAMEARGFGAMKKRTSYLAVKMGIPDYLYFCIFSCISVGVFVLYYLYV